MLELNVSVPHGFDDPLLAQPPDQQHPVGQVRFEFDMKCAKTDCQLYFASVADRIVALTLR